MPPITYDDVEDLKSEADTAADNLWGHPPIDRPPVAQEGENSIPPPVNPLANPLPSDPSIGNVLRKRFRAAGVTLPAQRPTSEDAMKEYRGNYAEMVRKEAVQKAVQKMFNPIPVDGTSPLDDEFKGIARRWHAGVRLHDELNPTNHLFKDKSRGHGQEAGSTDGRLLRKINDDSD